MKVTKNSMLISNKNIFYFFMMSYQHTLDIVDACIFLYILDFHIFHYFMQVVPTKVFTTLHNVDTFQYAVTEKVNKPNTLINM